MTDKTAPKVKAPELVTVQLSNGHSTSAGQAHPVTLCRCRRTRPAHWWPPGTR